MSLEAPYFSSPCLTPKRKSWILVRQLCTRDNGTKTAHQMLFIHWLTKITNDPIVQDASCAEHCTAKSVARLRRPYGGKVPPSNEPLPGVIRSKEVEFKGS